jgi:hypothetical protein
VPVTTIIVTGDPVQGYRYIGPFADIEDAEDWAERAMPNELWWAIPLIIPSGMGGLLP